MQPFLVTGTAILNDNIYSTYGGDVDNSTAAQRNVAYQIAEQFAIEEIGTLLTPTLITGTYPWPLADSRLKLKYNQIISVAGITTIHDNGCDCTLGGVSTTELSGCAHIIDTQNGVIDLRECNQLLSSSAGCCTCSVSGLPLLVRVATTQGHAAGVVAANPSSLMGLTVAADLALEQIIDPAGSESGPGDASVASFSDSGYSETRQFLRMTAFGGSPRANYAARMLKPLKFHGALKL